MSKVYAVYVETQVIGDMFGIWDNRRPLEVFESRKLAEEYIDFKREIDIYTSEYGRFVGKLEQSFSKPGKAYRMCEVHDAYWWSVEFFIEEVEKF